MKKIGISLRIEYFPKYNEKRDAISQDWLLFLKKANIFPILIPNTITNLTEFLNSINVDAIILSGGDNIGETPERDKTENEIINYSIQKKIPILGVCRGMQVLNNYFGGSLLVNPTNTHVGQPHSIEIINDKVAQIFDNSMITVNSYHNNIIKTECLGKNLQPFAVMQTDHTIEGYFHKTLPIVGVMWHPERDTNFQFEKKFLDILENKSLWDIN